MGEHTLGSTLYSTASAILKNSLQTAENEPIDIALRTLIRIKNFFKEIEQVTVVFRSEGEMGETKCLTEHVMGPSSCASRRLSSESISQFSSCPHIK